MKTIFLILLVGVLSVANFKDHCYAEEVPEVVKCPKPYIKHIKPLTALVGAKIAIRGNRFGNDVGSVIFTDNVSGEIVLWENKRIEAIVPEGAITGNVVVVRPCSSKSNTQFFSIK